MAGGASRSRVLVLTTFDLDEYVYEAVLAGASGFLLKDVAPDDLLHAVRVVARGTPERGESAAAVLDPPLVATTARGVVVVP